MAAQPPMPEEPIEEPAEPLKYKTWLLRVSVHCEGCKRKVKRILHGIEGVYTVDVDAKLHKATVTGNVDPETLIRKLEKSGKHAELWQDKNEHKGSKRSKKKKDKRNDQDDPESNNNNDFAPDDKENPEPTRIQVIGPPSRAVEVVSPGRPGGGVQFKEVRVDANGPENSPAPENLNQQEGGGAAGNGVNGGGGSKRRKKKKGNNSNNNGVNNQGEQSGNGNYNCNDGHGQPQHPPPGQCTAPMGDAPPPYRGPPCGYPVYNQPPPYYGPPMTAAPGYNVSYNMAYPTSNYTTSFYAGPPLHSYAYVHQGSDSIGGGPSPSETFEIFSDENPNACSVM